MERLKELIYEKKLYFIIGIITIIILLQIMSFYYVNQTLTRNQEEPLLLQTSIENNQEQEEIKEEKKEETKYIYVDIKGEVKTPGVYKLEENKRVIDAIKKAGGLTKNADTSANNLGMKLLDEMVIIIYSKDEIKDFVKTEEKQEKLEENCKKEETNITNNSCITNNKENQNEEQNNTNSNNDDNNTSNNKTNTTLININEATKEQLLTLPGVGDKKAEEIINYRNKTKFTSIEQLKEVSGIGEALYDSLKDLITV